jgi:lysozyme
MLWVGLGALGLFLIAQAQASEPTGHGDDLNPDVPGPLPIAPFSNLFNAGVMDAFAVDALSPSPELVAWLKGREKFSADKYQLGDGGVTIGWGHYEPFGPAADALPDHITQLEGDQLFAADLQSRGVDQVRKYVMVPLTQNQFDALVSLAFNLSPHSFATIADAVNAGEGIDPAAYNYVRAGTNLEAGLRKRRDAEVAMFNDGTYAA